MSKQGRIEVTVTMDGFPPYKTTGVFGPVYSALPVPRHSPPVYVEPKMTGGWPPGWYRVEEGWHYDY